MGHTTGARRPQPVLVIMGVSGAGKSVIARTLAATLGWELAEGDDLHPVANIAKMSAGTPLTDEDRWPWLDRVAAWIHNHTAIGVPGIITCSALKRSYRDKLSGDNVVFVHLAGSEETIGQRLAARTDHYMPATLLASQIGTLEPPESDENAVSIAAEQAPADVAAEIIHRLALAPEARAASRPHPPQLKQNTTRPSRPPEPTSASPGWR
jgi:gluconokinase